MLKDLKDCRLKFPFCRFVSLALICITVSGCFETGFRLEQTIRDAVDQAKAGNTATALSRLESLQEKHPQNPDLAEGLGVVYQLKGDLLLSSNYYQKAARLSPEKKYLLFEAAKNLDEAAMKQDAAKVLKEYLESFPENGEAWLLLGRMLSGLEENSEAVDALTRGILLTDPADLNASDHQLLGKLYLGIGDYPQADYYLNKAITMAETSQIEALALLGLVESSVQQGDWDVADVFLKRLESTDQSVYDSDEAQKVRQSVAEAQQTRNALVDDTIPVVELNPTPPEPAETSPSEPPSEQPEPEKVEDDVQPEAVNVEAVDATEQNTTEEDVAVENEETPPAEDLSTGTEETTEPEAEEEAAVETNTAETSEEPDQAQEPLDPYIPPADEAELLLVNARQLIVERQYPRAIRMTWDSINKKPDSPLAWYLLSRAYAGFGQHLNAESAALESMRLNPNNKRIVMNYLATLQYSRDARRFHEELLKVYQRFNKDPDIILALARSYARIMNDPDNAATLYRRFLDLEPDHDRAAEVRAEIPFVE